MKIKMKTLRGQTVSVFGIVVCSQMALSAQEARDWWFAGGPVLRGGMDVKITGSSYAQIMALNTDAGIGIGDTKSYADRIYDNGYVKRDSSGGAGFDPNTTWNWGYNNSSQYVPGSSLSFVKAGIPRYSNLDNGGSVGENNMQGGGFQIMAGLPMAESGSWSVDLVIGFQGIWSDHTYAENAGYVNITDTYNVSAIPAGSFPAPGHQGTFGGPFDSSASPPYSVIPNQPVSRAQTPAPPAMAGAQSRMSFDVNQGFYQINLGPQVGWKIGRQLKLNLRPTISMDVMDVSVDRSETFMLGNGFGLRTWKDSAEKCEVHLGLGINGGFDWQLGKGWFIGVTGGYDWVVNKLNVQVGPNNVAVDASGWQVGPLIGRRF